MATGLPGLGAVGRVIGPAEDPLREIYICTDKYIRVAA